MYLINVKQWIRVGLVALATCAAACDVGPEQAATEAPVNQGVQLTVPEQLASQYDAQVAEDFRKVVERLSETKTALGIDDDASSRVIVTFLGRARVLEYGSEQVDRLVDAPKTLELKERPGYVAWDTVSLQSKNEFRVEIPRTMVDEADAFATREGTNLGSDIVSEFDQAEELRRPDGEEPLQPPTDGLVLDDGTVVEAGWSNGVDTRSLRGTYNVAQTHTAYRKLVDIGGCSGTMVGPKHIVTAAHCIRSSASSAWISSTARAGRNGGGWRDSVSFSTSDTWYWTPSQYRSISDGLAKMPYSATPYDVGVIVTHGDRMGDTVGWMGWYWWGNDGDFGNRVRYNRGYPGCSASNAPSGCQSNGLYGDSAWCAVGEYSSPDSDGINRRFRFHCDISGGHSGSSMYHYLNGSSLVVTSIVSWEHCKTCSAGNDRPNTGVRITKSYSGSISLLRSMFP